jgi:hypothetical protein
MSSINLWNIAGSGQGIVIRRPGYSKPVCGSVNVSSVYPLTAILALSGKMLYTCREAALALAMTSQQRNYDFG